ncbi:MAG: hypothetical protein QGF33_13875, partial [Alphaproteobacteria bacterium]|nr:hypothetical protein [Alphaproteobacteria bacterium]
WQVQLWLRDELKWPTTPLPAGLAYLGRAALADAGWCVRDFSALELGDYYHPVSSEAEARAQARRWASVERNPQRDRAGKVTKRFPGAQQRRERHALAREREAVGERLASYLCPRCAAAKGVKYRFADGAGGAPKKSRAASAAAAAASAAAAAGARGARAAREAAAAAGGAPAGDGADGGGG